MTSAVINKRLTPVRLEFQNIRTPYSPMFEDVYFQAESGIEESTYIYLEGSGFTEACLHSKEQMQFTVGEVGFGVGLNFLLTYQYFLKHAKPDQKLTYISAEKFPVHAEDLQELYSRFPELDSVSRDLLADYPILTPGFHSLNLADGRVKLILMFGDATEMFQQVKLSGSEGIQFWYLDGFAPSRNPDAFQDSLFSTLVKVAAPDALGASFSTASWVRRALVSQGFEIKKRPGFGKKRECMQIVFPEKQPFLPEKMHFLKAGESTAVIGAGLSGTAIARALADRGHSIQLIDQQSIAAHASGNAVGLYNTQLSRLPNPISRFSQLSLMHFIREIKRLAIKTRKGILRFQVSEEALVTSEYPESFYENRDGGIYFPDCGMVSPKKLCEQRADHPLIHKIIAKVAQVDKTTAGFILKNSNNEKIIECQQVIYATGASQALDRFLIHPLLEELPIRPIRGQVIYVEPTEASQRLSHALVNSGYITPIIPEISGNNTHCVGATYQAKTILSDQEKVDSEILLEEAREKHPAFSSLTPESVTSTRVGFRLATPDKLPMIGPLYSANPLAAQDGEWLFLGMGSRGITYSSYGAEILASLMCGEVLPVEADLWEHLHSRRFILRKLKKTGAPVKKLG